ncbi:DUF4785 domain-containing protein [Thalassotalea insulae]|uniref:DUF4785 domain-containing protein n=1 Tax=Thalassotalea insulae TaxID=2056778 RepID=A0ABQ6GRV5_9GAMM|nr:DUF4785 domain-containing protein [Thalassotalea insulae]GLX78359.1 DUF4785 domain-containing protein [Thalassotalea insulae]
MKFLTLTYSALSVSAILLSSSLWARPLSSQSLDLVSVNAPEHKVERKSLHFSQPINSTQQLSFAAKPFTHTSDEYWLEVTGKQLNDGLDVNITQPGALIRLSGKRANAPGAVNSLAIDPEKIALSKGAEKLSSPFKQKVSQQQFATANIFPNSSAVQLDKRIGKGVFKLKVNQQLNGHERYLINVKEKGSPYRLKVTIPRQSILATQHLELDMAMHNKNDQLDNSRYSAVIKSPNGDVMPVKYQQHDGKYSITLPEMATSALPGQLYELQVSSHASDNGLKISRNGKVAFAISQPTAKMTGKVAVENTHAVIGVEVASEGRYEISAIVSGVNKLGEQQQVMLSRSAHYLQPGEQHVQLIFDTQLLKQASVLPPYQLSQLRLVDQSRMALLQQQQ